MPSAVKCGVTECTNNDNRTCTANAIEVRARNNKKAGTTDGTCCGSFKS